MPSCYIHSNETTSEILWFPLNLLFTVLGRSHSISYLADCEESGTTSCGQMLQSSISQHQIMNFINNLLSSGINRATRTKRIVCLYTVTHEILKQILSFANLFIKLLFGFLKQFVCHEQIFNNTQHSLPFISWTSLHLQRWEFYKSD